MEQLCQVIMIGTACMDEYFKVSQWIPEGDKIEASFLSGELGGMVPNAACVLAGLGVQTYFFDTMNPGPVTQKLLAQLQAYGVNTSLILTEPGLPDARCFIFQTENERTVIAIHSQKPPMGLTHHQRERMEKADYIYTTLFNFQNFENPIGLMDSLKKHGVKLVFDIENHSYSETDRTLIDQSHILFFNEYGFKSYCQGKDPDTVIKELLGCGVENITITLGHRGCQCYTRREALHVPGFKVPVVDPTGAGDTFNGAFLYGIIHKHSLYDTAVFANAAAALAVCTKGPKGGVRPASKIKEFISYKEAHL